MTNPTNGASLTLTAESPGDLGVHTILPSSANTPETQEAALQSSASNFEREPIISFARCSSELLPTVVKTFLWHFAGRVNALREHAHAHHKAYHRVHSALHLGYFGMVSTHGPYYIPAGMLFLVILIGYVLHLESDA